MEGGGGEAKPKKSKFEKKKSKGNADIESVDMFWGKNCLSPLEGDPWLPVYEKIYQWDLAEAVDNGELFPPTRNIFRQYQLMMVLLPFKQMI